MLAYGGGSPAAARRAARHGLAFIPQTSDPALAEVYDAEAERAGHPSGLTLAPPPGAPTSVFVAEDVDRAWDLLGPHLLHDARMYGRWMGAAGAVTASSSGATSVAELRAERGSYRIVTPAEAVELVAADGYVVDPAAVRRHPPGPGLVVAAPHRARGPPGPPLTPPASSSSTAGTRSGTQI